MLLRFEDDLCVTCPNYVTDGKGKPWRRATNAEPLKDGDHIVYEFREERVVVSTDGRIKTRKLNANDVVMWDGSYPESMPIETARVNPHYDFDGIDGDESLDPTLVPVGDDRLKVRKF